MLEFHNGVPVLQTDQGTLVFPHNDLITLRLAMLFEGECQGLGATKAAAKYGVSRPRYYQLLEAYKAGGALALQLGKRGPTKPFRRTDELVREVVRHRFLDPDASIQVIAQKLRQSGFHISNRSVWRVIEEMGVQKKTLRLQPKARHCRKDPDPADNQ
jgi:transposase